MIKKHYFADVIQITDSGSNLVGSCSQAVWFWQSSGKAYDRLTSEMKRIYGVKNQVVNFRRVK